MLTQKNGNVRAKGAMRIVCAKEVYSIACPGVSSTELLQADKILSQKNAGKGCPSSPGHIGGASRKKART